MTLNKSTKKISNKEQTGLQETVLESKVIPYMKINSKSISKSLTAAAKKNYTTLGREQ